MAANKYDAIIVGGGHNGLVAAGYLARARWKVLVLERYHLVGGACVTEETFPGFRMNTGAYVVSLLRPEIVRDFKLAKFGYEPLTRDPSSFSPYPGNRHLIFWKDNEATKREVARFSARDAERFDAFNRHLEEMVALLDPLAAAAPPEIKTGGWGERLGWLMWWARKRHPVSDAKLLARIADITRLLTVSVAEYLDRWFESEEVKVRYCTDGVIGLLAGPHSPGTAYGMFHHLMGQHEGRRGEWAYVRGGMGAITQALADYVRSQGGEIVTGAEVARIAVKSGAVAGVALADGREFQANVVLSNADPKRTFLKLFDPLDLPEDLLADVRRLKTASGATKINIAARALPDFHAYPGREVGPQHRGTIHFSPSMAYIEKAFEDCKAGRPSAEPFIEMGIPSAVDPSVAPPGKHYISCFVQYAPYTRADGKPWDAATEAEFAEATFNVIRQYCSNWDEVVENYQILTPPKIEQRFGLTGGNIFQVEISPDQLFHMRPTPQTSGYATPVRGFYLCGAGSHPGGGVYGAPGWLAAQRVLKDRLR